MLVLSRKQFERIRIGPDIIVSVQEIRGGLVRIGVVAPDNVDIHREEVFERIEGARSLDGNGVPIDPLPGSPLAEEIGELAKSLARSQAASIVNEKGNRNAD